MGDEGKRSSAPADLPRRRTTEAMTGLELFPEESPWSQYPDSQVQEALPVATPKRGRPKKQNVQARPSRQGGRRGSCHSRGHGRRGRKGGRNEREVDQDGPVSYQTLSPSQWHGGSSPSAFRNFHHNIQAEAIVEGEEDGIHDAPTSAMHTTTKSWIG
jgi:hypothetical protein